MRLKDFCRSLRGSEATLRKLSLLEEARLITSLNPSDLFRRVALQPDSSHAEVYRAGMAGLDYNFLLTDLSFFQFYHSEYPSRSGVRYAFYPNPYPVIKFEDFVRYYEPEDTIPSWDDYLQHLSELPQRARSPIIRYDVAPQDHEPLSHSTAHFHFGLHEENRWPCERFLTPHAFLLLILKQFFSEAWKAALEAEEDCEIGQTEMEKLFIREKAASPMLGDDLFTPIERRQLYFT